MVPWLSYYDDRDDAKGSGRAMARALARLLDWFGEIKQEGERTGRQFCQQHLHLVAHSMGNYALRHAVQALKRDFGRPLPRIFENVFLMASDEDDDTFEKDHKLGILPELARAVHVYFSTDDVPLDEIADITKGLPDRLGTQGPRHKDGLHRKINLVDCTSVDYTALSHAWHQYYRGRQEVIEDVRQVLAGIPLRDMKGRTYQQEERAYRIWSFDERAERDES